MYRPPNGDMTVFEMFYENLLSANDKTSKNIIFAGDLNINVLTVCSYHVTYAFQSESTLYSCLNVKELLARSRREI